MIADVTRGRCASSARRSSGRCSWRCRSATRPRRSGSPTRPQYGLAAYVWTNDLTRAHRVAHAIDTGLCWINSQNVRDLRTPFGGVKQQRHRPRGRRLRFEFYCEIEIVHVALGDAPHPAARPRRGRRRRVSAVEAARLGRRRRSTSCGSRTSSCVVTDLAASREFYVDAARARRHRRDVGRALPARLGGASAPLARPAAQAPSRCVDHIAFRVRTRRPTSTRSPPLRGARLRVDVGRRRELGPGPGAARARPARLPARVLPRDGAGATPLQRFDLQRGAPITRFDHVNLHVPDCEEAFDALPAARLPLLGVHLDRRRRRAAHRPPGSTASRPCTTSR